MTATIGETITGAEQARRELVLTHLADLALHTREFAPPPIMLMYDDPTTGHIRNITRGYVLQPPTVRADGTLGHGLAFTASYVLQPPSSTPQPLSRPLLDRESIRVYDFIPLPNGLRVPSNSPLPPEGIALHALEARSGRDIATMVKEAKGHMTSTTYLDWAFGRAVTQSNLGRDTVIDRSSNPPRVLYLHGSPLQA